MLGKAVLPTLWPTRLCQPGGIAQHSEADATRHNGCSRALTTCAHLDTELKALLKPRQQPRQGLPIQALAERHDHAGMVGSTLPEILEPPVADFAPLKVAGVSAFNLCAWQRANASLGV